MAHYYELTIAVRTDESKSADAFEAAADRVASRLDGHAMHRVREVSAGEVPASLRENGEGA